MKPHPSLVARLTVLAAVTSAVVRCGQDAGSPVTSPMPHDATLQTGDTMATIATSATSDVVLVGAGNIARCAKTTDDATANLLDQIAGTVFTAGDNTYPSGTTAEYADCYTPTWGRHKARTRPAPGEKDYQTDGGAPYFAYFGAAAGDPDKGYYSYELGAWHIVVLNSNTVMTAGSPQEQWLRADLAANPKRCTLAVWHHPRFYSNGGTLRSSVKPLWDALYAHDAELILNGHDAYYERFAPQTPDGVLDMERGIRQIIIGTGGSHTNSFGTVRPNSEVRHTGTAGVLKLTLSEASYSWEFVPVAGKTFADSGTTACQGGEPTGDNQPPVADPAGPYTGTEGAAVVFDGSGSSDPDGDTPLTYRWNFGDSGSGEGQKPSHTYADNGSYTVTLTVTDPNGASSTPVTTTADVTNVAPAVDAGADVAGRSGETVTINAHFRDPGASDAPWSYTIAWGDSQTDTGTTSDASVPISRSHAYVNTGSYTVRVTVRDKDGAEGSDALVAAISAGGGSSSAVILAGGDIAGCEKTYDEKVADVIAQYPGVPVFTLGDNAYPDGTLEEHISCYGPSWGRFKDRTWPAAGNREYNTPGAQGHFEYWGARAGEPGKGYYSLDIGEWHVVVLDSNYPAGVGTKAGSPQEQWLRADLAANPKRCTLAIWHHPRFWSGSGSQSRDFPRAFWDALYEHGAELILNGHAHNYERFAPQTPAGQADSTRGIRQIIVGTGGYSLGGFGSPAPNSEVRQGATYGVLKLTLEPDAYTWEFLPIAGSSFTDSGRTACH